MPYAKTRKDRLVRRPFSFLYPVSLGFCAAGQRLLPFVLLKSLNVRGLQVFLIFHLLPVHTRFMQSKQRIDWDSSPPYRQVAAYTDAGAVKLMPAKQIKLATSRPTFGFVILSSLSKTR